MSHAFRHLLALFASLLLVATYAESTFAEPIAGSDDERGKYCRAVG
ncbi:MAG: hypothetical protein R3E58_13240 [Phycisphaerae bacterium]